MTSSDAQKSEVHAATADADSSPTRDADLSTRGSMHRTGWTEPPRQPTPLSPGTHVVRDETGVGGPLIVESDDPDLSPPHVPIDPFPTERKPEIDPPVT